MFLNMLLNCMYSGYEPKPSNLLYISRYPYGVPSSSYISWSSRVSMCGIWANASLRCG